MFVTQYIKKSAYVVHLDFHNDESTFTCSFNKVDPGLPSSDWPFTGLLPTALPRQC